MSPFDRRIVEQLKTRLILAAPNRLRKMIVFGSRARGDGGKDADLDIMILVDKMTSEMEFLVDDMAYSVMWEWNFDPILSLKVCEESRFEVAVREGLPFFRNVFREGVIL